jgi:hypothetical protein
VALVRVSSIWFFIGRAFCPNLGARLGHPLSERNNPSASSTRFFLSEAVAQSHILITCNHRQLLTPPVAG